MSSSLQANKASHLNWIRLECLLAFCNINKITNDSNGEKELLSHSLKEMLTITISESNWSYWREHTTHSRETERNLLVCWKR